MYGISFSSSYLTLSRRISTHTCSLDQQRSFPSTDCWHEVCPSSFPKRVWLTVIAAYSSSHANQGTYRHWRTLTFALLFPGKGIDIEPAPYLREDLDQRIKDVQNEIWRSLWRYAQREIPASEKKEARIALEDIVEAAIHFDLDVRKHISDMVLSSPSCKAGSAFHPRRMVDVRRREGESEGTVNLVVSPPLYKDTSQGGDTKFKLITSAQVCSGVLKRATRSTWQKALSPVYTAEPSSPKIELDDQEPAYAQYNHVHQDRQPSRDSRGGSSIRRPMSSSNRLAASTF